MSSAKLSSSDHSVPHLQISRLLMMMMLSVVDIFNLAQNLSKLPPPSVCHILLNTADKTPTPVTTSITFNNFRGNGLLEEAAGKLKISCFGRSSNNQATLLSCFPIQSGIERETDRDAAKRTPTNKRKHHSKQTNMNKRMHTAHVGFSI